MLHESVKNDVLCKIAKIKSKMYRLDTPISLSFDRFEREVREAYDFESLIGILHKNQYTWDWFSSTLERILGLGYPDVYKLAMGFSRHPHFVISSNCEDCDDEG